MRLVNVVFGELTRC